MKIMVIDTETTSLDAWNGNVIEIAVCELDVGNYTYELVYDSLVGYPQVRESAWIFDHSDLTPEEVIAAYPECNVFTVANQVRKVVRGALVTSYNVAFDFAFLHRSPWRLAEVYDQLGSCVMLWATDLCGLERYDGSPKWPKLTEAYRYLVKKPLPNNGHRAGMDCSLAAEVLLKMIEEYNYRFNGEN